MQWRAASDKLPPNKVDVFIKEYGGLMDIGWYSEDDERIHTESDLGPLSIYQVYWLDESTPASAEEEAARMYPYDYENYDKEDHERVKAIRDAMRLAHIRCAGMYTGEIDRLKAEVARLEALRGIKHETKKKTESSEKHKIPSKPNNQA